MFSQTQIASKIESVKKNFVYPLDNFLKSFSNATDFLNEIDHVLSEKYINGEFSSIRFPIKCSAIGFNHFSTISRQCEVELFSHIFRSKLFITTVLNRAQFILISVKECEEFLANKHKLEDLDEHDLIFILLPDDKHIQLIQVINSKEAVLGTSVKAFYYDSELESLHHNNVKKVLKMMYPLVPFRLILTKKGICPKQEGRTCGLSSLTNFLFAVKSKPNWETKPVISYKHSGDTLFRLYFQLFIAYRNFCLMQDIMNIFQKYKVMIPKKARGIVDKVGKLNSLIHEFERIFVSNFGFKHEYK